MDDEHSSALRRARRSVRAERDRQLTAGADECVSLCGSLGDPQASFPGRPTQSAS